MYLKNIVAIIIIIIADTNLLQPSWSVSAHRCSYQSTQWYCPTIFLCIETPPERARSFNRLSGIQQYDKTVLAFTARRSAYHGTRCRRPVYAR